MNSKNVRLIFVLDTSKYCYSKFTATGFLPWLYYFSSYHISRNQLCNRHWKRLQIPQNTYQVYNYILTILQRISINITVIEDGLIPDGRR